MPGKIIHTYSFIYPETLSNVSGLGITSKGFLIIVPKLPFHGIFYRSALIWFDGGLQ